MRKIRDVLRLGHGLPQRAVGRSLGLSQAAVSHYLGRARRAGLGWPLPEGLDDDRLEALLFPPMPDLLAERRLVPDWAWAHRELRRSHVRLTLLWPRQGWASVPVPLIAAPRWRRIAELWQH